MVEDIELALDVGVTLQGGYSPVADGDADVVETNLSNLVKVFLGDPCVPVVAETGVGFGRP